ASGRERREVSQDGYPSEQARDHLLGGLGEALLLLLEVGLPGRERPDLEPIERADHGAFPVQVRVGAQMARDGDAALLVRDDVLRSGQQHPQVVTGAPIGGGRPTGFLELLAELGERGHGDAVPLSASHDQSRGELVTELRRKDQASLVVELGREGAEEHPGPPSLTVTRDPKPHLLPTGPTLPHYPPPNASRMPKMSHLTAITAGSSGGGRWGGKWCGTRDSVSPHAGSPAPGSRSLRRVQPGAAQRCRS